MGPTFHVSGMWSDLCSMKTAVGAEPPLLMRVGLEYRRQLLIHFYRISTDNICDRWPTTTKGERKWI